MNCRRTFDGFRRREVDRLQLCAVGNWPKHFTVEHVRPTNVRRITMGTGDNLVRADVKDRRAENAPLFHFSDADAGVNVTPECLRMFFASEIRVTELLI